MATVIAPAVLGFPRSDGPRLDSRGRHPQVNPLALVSKKSAAIFWGFRVAMKQSFSCTLAMCPPSFPYVAMYGCTRLVALA